MDFVFGVQNNGDDDRFCYFFIKNLNGFLPKLVLTVRKFLALQWNVGQYKHSLHVMEYVV